MHSRNVPHGGYNPAYTQQGGYPQPYTPQPQYAMPPNAMPSYPQPTHQQTPSIPAGLALGQAPQQQVQPSFEAQLAQQRNDISRLEMMLRGLQGNIAGPALRVKFPEQLDRAGVVEYPDLVAHPFFWGKYELREGAQGNQPFATSGGESSIIVQLDLIYSYIDRLHFFMFRQQAPNGDNAPNLVEGDFIPVSAKNTYVLGPTDRWQSFPFEFRLRSGSNVDQWQTEWIPSSVLERLDQDGYPLPVEYKAYNKDSIRVEARPLRARVVGDPLSEIVRLYVGFSGYKMYLEKQ